MKNAYCCTRDRRNGGKKKKCPTYLISSLFGSDLRGLLYLLQLTFKLIWIYNKYILMQSFYLRGNGDIIIVYLSYHLPLIYSFSQFSYLVYTGGKKIKWKAWIVPPCLLYISNAIPKGIVKCYLLWWSVTMFSFTYWQIYMLNIYLLPYRCINNYDIPTKSQICICLSCLHQIYLLNTNKLIN